MYSVLLQPIFLIFLFISCSTAVLDVSWWSSVAQLSTSSLLPKSTRSICNDLQGLSPGQINQCELFQDHMPAVGKGAKQAIDECEHQFKNQRWNCSTPPEAGVIGPIHKFGTREAAFTYAILFAGVTHEVSRRCRLGQLKTCGCFDTSKLGSDVDKRNPGEEWTWGGCGDNIVYGSQFAKNFIDVRERESSKRSESKGRAMMNSWNNEAGRKIVKRHTRPKCKCHGVSGSCNMKTCWMQLPSMRQVGEILETKYRTARRIQINTRGNMQFVGQPEKRHSSKKKRMVELVFLDDSPDYCTENRTQGTVGTKGRICTKDLSAPNSCDLLCCGRGYNSYINEVTYKCKCKFQWCCEVVCEQCTNQTQVHVCK